jgi:hypothetical protein
MGERLAHQEQYVLRARRKASSERLPITRDRCEIGRTRPAIEPACDQEYPCSSVQTSDGLRLTPVNSRWRPRLKPLKPSSSLRQLSKLNSQTTGLSTDPAVSPCPEVEAERSFARLSSKPNCQKTSRLKTRNDTSMHSGAPYLETSQAGGFPF